MFLSLVLFFLSFLEIEFNVTGNYGSPVHTNHNANYSSMPSPDMDQIDRKPNDQSRRPLSVATDNMMLEFYKKDGYDPSVSTGSTKSTKTGIDRKEYQTVNQVQPQEEEGALIYY